MLGGHSICQKVLDETETATRFRTSGIVLFILNQ